MVELALAAAVAANHGLLALGIALAAAAGALFLALDLDLLLDAVKGLEEADFEVVADIPAGGGAGATAAAAAAHPEEVLEDVGEVAEDVAHVFEAMEALVAQAGVAVLVVEAAFLRVAQDLVGLGGLFEELLGLVAGVAVGVVFEGLFAVGGLDLGGRGLAVHAQNFVIIPLHDLTFAKSLGGR